MTKTLEEPMIKWKHKCESSGIKGILAFKTIEGARLYFRFIGPNQIEIVGFASKHQQEEFYKLLRKYYDKS